MQENIEKPRQTPSMATQTSTGSLPSPSPQAGRSAYQGFPSEGDPEFVRQQNANIELDHFHNSYPIDTGSPAAPYTIPANPDKETNE